MPWDDKPIFNGLLHTKMPDLEALYRVGKINPYAWNSFPGWTDKLDLPTPAWYDAFAAGAVAPRGIVMVDHEAWPYETQAERRATAGKYVVLYQQIKQRRPDLRIGWYKDPIRRDFWRAITGRDSQGYKAWQSENNDLAAIMAPFTDVFCPSLYFFHSRDTNDDATNFLGVYLEENLREARRIRRQYGRLESPIYPYIWYRKHDDTRDLDGDVWETVVRTVLEHADGLVLWGGWKPPSQPSGPLPWDENAPWWVTIKARLTDKRRTG